MRIDNGFIVARANLLSDKEIMIWAARTFGDSWDYIYTFDEVAWMYRECYWQDSLQAQNDRTLPDTPPVEKTAPF